MAKARITVTMPARLVEAADRRAGELRRSRSFVLAEALRAYLTERPPMVREATAPYAAGLGPSRLAQLEADLSQTPEERVALAEEAALVAELARPCPRRHQVLVFDSIEAFHAWERREAVEW